MELITTATAITATTIFSTFLGMYCNDHAFAYNVAMEEQEQVVTSQTVYKKSESGKQLSHHLKYNYTYDEQGRLALKEVMKWNEATGQWEHSHCLRYVYGPSGLSIEFIRWNPQEAGYTEVLNKQVYDHSMEGSVAVALYKWDKAGNGWVMQDNAIMLNPGGKLLAGR